MVVTKSWNGKFDIKGPVLFYVTNEFEASIILGGLWDINK